MSSDVESPLTITFDPMIFGHQQYGGVSRYFAQLHAEFQAFDDIDSRVVAGLHANSYLDRSVPKTLGLRFNRFPGPLRDRFARLNGFASTSLMLAMKSDIIHQTTYTPLRNSEVPLITTVHDFIHELFPQYFESSQYAEEKAAAVARADGIVCISESTRRDFEQIYGPPTKPLLVAHHGLSGSPLTYEEADQLVPVRMRGPKTLLFVGTRSRYKAFDLLLEALGQIGRGDSRLVCVGPPLSKHELDMCQRFGIDPATIECRSVGEDELTDLYRRSFVTVYPSLYEGFGLPVVESMAQGCPVVCGRTSSLPEVGGEAAEYFSDHTAEAISETLQRLLAYDASTYRAVSHRSVDQAVKFSWKHTAQAHSRFYQEVAVPLRLLS